MHNILHVLFCNGYVIIYQLIIRSIQRHPSEITPFINPTMDKWLHSFVCVRWNELPSHKLQGATVEVWEWISNFIRYLTGGMLLVIHAGTKVESC